MITYTLIGAVALIAIFYRIAVKYREYRDDQDIARLYGCKPPPRVSNQRPFGIDRLEQIFRADAEGRLMEFFLSHCQRIGYTQDQVFLGTQAFGTNDPANLETILSTDFKDFSFGLRREISFPMFGDGIFTQEGEAWKHSREMLRPQFHHKHYADLDVFKPAVDDLLDSISHGGVVDLHPLFFRLTLDTTTAFLFGESVRSLKAPASSGERNFAEAFDTAQKYVAQRFRLLDLYRFIGGAPFRSACKSVHDFADQVIDRNLAKDKESASNNGNRYVFLRSLAEKAKDRASLRGQIVNILVAGRDTTACLLSWTFFLLVRHPEVLQKLRADIAQSMKGQQSGLNRDLLRDMKYLQNVIKETLRLYPSVPLNIRTAVRTTVLPTGGGPDRKSPILIRKGTSITWGPYVMHRRADFYGMDALSFRPERWDEDMPMNRDPILAKWGYLPFNGGPRICLGMDFALTEAAYTIVRILQRFDSISLPVDSPVDLLGVERQTVTLVLQSRDGCRVDLG